MLTGNLLKIKYYYWIDVHSVVDMSTDILSIKNLQLKSVKWPCPGRMDEYKWQADT